MLPGWDTRWTWRDQNNLIIQRKRRGVLGQWFFLAAIVGLFGYHVLDLGRIPPGIHWQDWLVMRYQEQPLLWVPTLLPLLGLPRMIRGISSMIVGDKICFGVTGGRIERNGALIARFGDVVLVQLHKERDGLLRLSLVLKGNKTVELESGRQAEVFNTLAGELADLLQVALRRT